MSRYIGPKLRKKQKFGLAPMSASIRRQQVKPRRKSDYAARLEEKQKLKFIYGVMERQMKRYVREVFEHRGDLPVELLQTLESRLDNIVFRLGLSKTRGGARQLVNHGHILVDGKKVDIPSYILKSGQTVSANAKLLKKPAFLTDMENNRQAGVMFGHLLYDNHGGKFLGQPAAGDLPQEVDVAKVLEFYRQMV